MDLRNLLQDTSDDTRIVNWDDLSDDVGLLSARLDELPVDEPIRIDLRLNRLPLEAVDVLILYLRKNSRVSSCVGNNAFNFTAFYNKLIQLEATHMLNGNRLTLGFTENEIHTDHLAAKALSEGRVLNLDDTLAALDKLKTNQEDFAENFKQMAIQHDIAHRRVQSLEGYNANGNNAIEYCISDKVDDYMQSLGYELEERESRTVLFGADGAKRGELDGLMLYEHPITKKKVAIMVEAKSHMSTGEYAKVHKTYNCWRACIEEATQDEKPFWKTKYKRQCGSFKALRDYDQLVAVGSPSMPSEIAESANNAGYLVVSQENDSYCLKNNSEWIAKHNLV